MTGRPNANTDGDQFRALWSVGLAIRGFMLRTGQGPLRPVWSLAYWLLLRGVAAWLRRRTAAAVYVGGTFGAGEPVYGISDVDMIAVVPADAGQPGQAHARVRERWHDLCRRLGPVSWVVSEVYVYEDAELKDATASTCLTYGLNGGSAAPAVFFGRRRPGDEGVLLVRPGLWATRDWRLVAGSDLRPAGVVDPAHRRLAAWLELQFWWRLAIATCCEPVEPHAAYLCVKLAAEPARILLWLEHGEQVLPRRAVLERAAELYPEEEHGLRRALELQGQLNRSPEAPLEEFLPLFVRLSTRVAEVVAGQICTAGATDVRLVGDRQAVPVLPGASLESIPPGSRPLPLLDWRARVRPRLGDEAFVLLGSSPSSPDLLAGAAREFAPGVYAALEGEGLLVLPAASGGASEMRSVQCAATDPVSFALVEGRDVATFPDVPGLSSLDSARRAIAEHRAWLEANDAELRAGTTGSDVTRLVMLLSAARATCFAESLREGDPELALTLEAAAELLSARDPGAAVAVEEGFAAYRDARIEGRAVAKRTVAALYDVVRRSSIVAGTR